MNEPIHTTTPPRDGWYFVFGKPRDPNKPMASRPKVPVRIWTVEERDEAGDLIDDVRQYVKVGNDLRVLTQEEWLFVARRPISQEEYEALFIMGDWQ